jgi:hypothetical protein
LVGLVYRMTRAGVVIRSGLIARSEMEKGKVGFGSLVAEGIGEWERKTEETYEGRETMGSIWYD